MTSLVPLSIKVDPRVQSTLAKFAAEQSVTVQLYAQLIWEAAYAVRCGASSEPAMSDAMVRLAAESRRLGAATLPVSRANAQPPQIISPDALEKMKAELRQLKAEQRERVVVDTDRVAALEEQNAKLKTTSERLMEGCREFEELVIKERADNTRLRSEVTAAAKARDELGEQLAEMTRMKDRALSRAPAAVEIDQGSVARALEPLVQQVNAVLDDCRTALSGARTHAASLQEIMERLAETAREIQAAGQKRPAADDGKPIWKRSWEKS